MIELELDFSEEDVSFANKKEDVELIRELVGERSFVISKIETLTGIRNIDDISERSDALLLDRGDLSRQLPIEQIPRAQKEIINIAKQNHVKCYVFSLRLFFLTKPKTISKRLRFEKNMNISSKTKVLSMRYRFENYFGICLN